MSELEAEERRVSRCLKGSAHWQREGEVQEVRGQLRELIRERKRRDHAAVIYIIQCLCPNRHAIYATVYDPEELPHDVAMATMQQQIEEWIAKKTINPWCGICQSRDWTYEQRKTKYKSMEEAKAEMKQLELENMLSRIIIDEKKAEKN